MKKYYPYFLIIVIISSCNNYYKSAEEWYLLGHFDVAKKKLTKIKESDSDYKNAKLLISKIDSIYYQQAYEQYFINNNLEKSTELLRNINSQSSLNIKKNQLLRANCKKK